MGLGQAALSGFGTYTSMKAPSAGDFGGGNSWGYGTSGGKQTFGADLFKPNTSFGGSSWNFNTSAMKWNPNNTFGIGL